MTARRLLWSEWATFALPVMAVLLLFLPAISHPDYLLYPTFSPHSDLTVIHWPKANLIAETWRLDRQLPLWSPANMSGMPLAANQLAMLFYPPAWLLLVLPVEPVLNLLFALHLLWCILGTYLLLRRTYNLDRSPALLGATAFALSGKLLAHMSAGHVSMIAALAWLPWAFLGLRLMLRSGRARWSLLVGMSLAMQITTHTLITLYSVYLLIAFTCWWTFSRLVQREPIHLRRALPGLALIPLIAAGLGAVQLLPLAELAAYSNRSLSITEAGAYALTPLQLLFGLLLPSTAAGHEYVIYLGLIPWLLVGLGIQRRPSESWFWIGVIGAGVLFSLGPLTPLFGLTYRWLPGMQWVRTPARAFFIVALGVSILAALGAQRLVRSPLRWSNLPAVAAGGFCLALGAGMAIIGGQVNRQVLSLALLPGLGLLVMGLCARRRQPANLAILTLTAVLTLDLVSFGLSLRHFVSPREAFAEGRAAAEYLASQPDIFRTYSPSYSLPSQAAARAGLQTADGVEPVHLEVYDRFMELAGGYGSNQPGTSAFSVTIPRFPTDKPMDEALADVEPDLKLLGLLNVGYIVSAFPVREGSIQLLYKDADSYVYANPEVLPRAWLIPADDKLILPIELAAGQAWRDALSQLAEQGAQSDLSTTDITDHRPNAVSVVTRAREPALLVFSEMWYPGWQASIDGWLAPVDPVAGLLRGVRLPAGVHEVQLVYRPLSVIWGARFSLTALTIAFCAVVYLALRRQPGAKDFDSCPAISTLSD